MDTANEVVAASTTSGLQCRRNDGKSTDYSDLNSIAKDRDARNEILDNDSFIDELCEKVFKKLKTKLGKMNFCGANCNANGNCDVGAKV